MKKEMYAETELEIIRFTAEDVILTTGESIPGEDSETSGQLP